MPSPALTAAVSSFWRRPTCTTISSLKENMAKTYRNRVRMVGSFKMVFIFLIFLQLAFQPTQRLKNTHPFGWHTCVAFRSSLWSPWKSGKPRGVILLETISGEPIGREGSGSIFVSNSLSSEIFQVFSPKAQHLRLDFKTTIEWLIGWSFALEEWERIGVALPSQQDLPIPPAIPPNPQLCGSGLPTHWNPPAHPTPAVSQGL